MSNENSASGVTAQQNPGPEVIRELESLRAKLAALETANVVEGRFQGEAPKYLLNGPIYVDDTLFPTGSTVEYLDTPNTDMVPLNEPAQRRMQAYLDELNEAGQRKAMLDGRDWRGLVTDRGNLLEMAMESAKKAAAVPVPLVKMPERIDNVPAMPNQDGAEARRRGRPPGARKVVSSTAPAPMGADLGAPVLAPTTMGPAIVGRMVSN